MSMVIIRADASSTIGHGHVIRCLALANALKENGLEIMFVSREHPGHLCGLIEERGFTVNRLPERTVHTSLPEPMWEIDAQETIAAISSTATKPSWMIVDHYDLDHRWEKTLRASVENIFVVDDLANRKHDCDLILDHNLVTCMNTRYNDWVPVTSGMLLGPDYALIHQDYSRLHREARIRQGEIKHILIYFGGADNDNLTGRTLTAFLSQNRPGIEVDVVIALGSKHAPGIRRQTSEHANVHVHENLSSLALLMARADLAIGACGVTSWERLCLGLPALAVILEKNQQPIAEELNRRGLIKLIGHKESVNETVISEYLSNAINEGLNEEWSKKCHMVVDGNGAARVCSILTITADSPVRIRHASLEDEDILLRWANDPLTRKNAFSPTCIDKATHRKWFKSQLLNSNRCRFYIMETSEGVGLGQARFTLCEDSWETHYSIAAGFRGRGLGRRLLEEATAKLREQEGPVSVFGRVKQDNHVSQKTLESSGFKAKVDDSKGVITYWKEL